MVRYVTYLRKSTDERTRQIQSLATQQRIVRDLAADRRLQRITTLQESRSAKAPGRPVFNRMLQLIEQGDADGIICCAIDRLYRNPVDEGRVRWLLQQGIIKSIVTAEREFIPRDSGLLMAVEGGKANDEIIRLRNRVMEGVRQKLLSGGWPGQRPFGYRYSRLHRNIIPHPSEAKIVQQIYVEVVRDHLSINAVRARLAVLGVRSKSGKLVAREFVRRLLTNELYIGIMVWRGESFDGRYKTIITPELFEQVASVVAERSKPRISRMRHDFPFRGIFRCSCAAMVSAQFARGNGGLYRYYRCSRKVAPCSEPYVLEEDLAGQCFRFAASLGISPEEAESGRATLDRIAREDEANADTALDRIDAALKDVQTHLDRLANGLAIETIDEDSYAHISAEFMLKKKKLKAERHRIQLQLGAGWIEPAREVISWLELAGKPQSAIELSQMAGLMRKIGTNHRIHTKIVGAEFAAPYDFVATLLAETRVSSDHVPANQSSPRRSGIHWCRVLDHLRTHFHGPDVCIHRDSNL